MTTTTCRAHGKTWTGTVECHCETCGENFTNVGTFDAHRKGPLDSRTCSIPPTFVEVRPGVWGRPAPESASDSDRLSGKGHS